LLQFDGGLVLLLLIRLFVGRNDVPSGIMSGFYVGICRHLLIISWRCIISFNTHCSGYFTVSVTAVCRIERYFCDHTCN